MTLILVEQSRDSLPGEGVSRKVIAALEQEITAQVPDRIVLPSGSALRWLLAARHAPFTLVECLTHLGAPSTGGMDRAQDIRWSLVVHYAVPGMLQVTDPGTGETNPVMASLPIEEAPLVRIPLAGLGLKDGDLVPAAGRIAAFARDAPLTVPRHLRLGLAGLRYHVGQRISGDARSSIVALARNEVADPATAPTAADQARRLGLSPQLLGKWKNTVDPAVDDDAEKEWPT